MQDRAKHLQRYQHKPGKPVPYSYPEWLQKTGSPILWAFRGKPESPISRGVVKFHRRGKVYIAGKFYGIWFDPNDIVQVTDPGNAAILD